MPSREKAGRRKSATQIASSLALITNPRLKKDLLQEPEQKKEGDRIHLHVRKEPRPEDAASRPEDNRRTTIQDRADRQPLEKKRKTPHTSY